MRVRLAHMRLRMQRLSRFLVPALAISLAGAQCLAALPQTAAATRTNQVRAALENLGANRNISVRMASGETVHGHIGPLGKQSFTLRSGNTERKVPYNQVAQIRPAPRTWLWVAIGVAAGVIVVVIIALARTPAVHSPGA